MSESENNNKNFEQAIIETNKNQKQEVVNTTIEQSNQTITKGDVALADTESFSYIVPHESWKKHNNKHNKHSKKHHKNNDTPNTDRLSVEGRKAMANGFVFEEYHKKSKHKRKHKHHMKKGKKIAIIVVSIILALAIAAVSSIFILKEVGRKQLLSLEEDDKLEITPPTKVEDVEVKVEDDGRVIYYNGNTYEINKDIATLLFVGLDQETTDANDENADAIYLMAIDTNSKTIKVISISRDTMCDVDIYTNNGNFSETKKLQICKAFEYGNSPKMRSENVVKSAQRFLYNIPIGSYFVIDLTCISTLNDEVGGIEVKSNFTFTSPEDGRTINEGESVILHGKEAETYVRHRTHDELNANEARMQRQQQYLKKFMASIVPAAKKDISVIPALYSTITEHSTTDLSLPKLTYLASSAVSLIKSSDDIKFINFTGDYSMNDSNNAEFYPNEKQVLETVLDVFYKKVK